jgi:alpha-galactosidase
VLLFRCATEHLYPCRFVELHAERIDVEVNGVRHSAPLVGAGEIAVGPLVVTVDFAHGSDACSWGVANVDDRPCRVRAVRLVYRVVADGPLRMLRHGYQSWSRTGVATLGVDTDPSTTPGSLEMVQGIHHADQRAAIDDELRSEWVTVLADDAPEVVRAGFVAGVDHDGTWRLRPAQDGGVELVAEAFLGDATIGSGEMRPLHAFDVERGEDAPTLLDGWARTVGDAGRARVHAPYQVGWCSWYHYFHGVTEDHLRANLARASDWPFEVFQLDDGYQAAIGDWLVTNHKFPSDLATIASTIRSAGRRPGIWIAPFIVAPDSRVATEHPGWLARFDDGKPLWGMFNPEWGGGRDGVMYALDTTMPEVVEHLEQTAADLVDAGFTYLKLDFTFAPSFDGVWHDPRCTPAQRVRAGYDAIRRGAGDDAFLLGCGVPLSHVVGVVDGNRIGPDVAPSWERSKEGMSLPGYADVEPATLHAWIDTLARSFMHRRLWLNDPDCLMLRTDETAMTRAAVETWARAVALSGGMALVSDDLALLDADARTLLDDVVRIGREVDQAASMGAAPRCDDLLDHEVPRTLRAAGYALEADPATATSTLRSP